MGNKRRSEGDRMDRRATTIELVSLPCPASSLAAPIIFDRHDKLDVLLAKFSVVVPELCLDHGRFELPGIAVRPEAPEAVRESLAEARLRALSDLGASPGDECPK